MIKLFDLDIKQLKKIMKPELYIGRAASQVEEFLKEYVRPILEAEKDLLGLDVELKV